MPRMGLVVVLGAAVFPLYAAELSGDELVEKVLTTERQVRLLPTLEKRTRSQEKRLALLENKVRDVQTKLDLLEFQLESIENKLKKIQAQLAAMTGQKPQEQPSQTPSGNEESKTPPVATFASIRSQQVRVVGEFLQITGIVANTSSKPLTFVVVEATFLDGRGHIVKTASGYTSPRVIPPGGTATFKIVTRRDARIRNHRLSVRSQ